jgi:hypothetical protein
MCTSFEPLAHGSAPPGALWPLRGCGGGADVFPATDGDPDDKIKDKTCRQADRTQCWRKATRDRQARREPPTPNTIKVSEVSWIERLEFRAPRQQTGENPCVLQSPAGTTIDAIVKATAWQQHSVRGFLAGIVRKKLKLNLISERSDDVRVYRVAKDAAAATNMEG